MRCKSGYVCVGELIFCDSARDVHPYIKHYNYHHFSSSFELVFFFFFVCDELPNHACIRGTNNQQLLCWQTFDVIFDQVFQCCGWQQKLAPRKTILTINLSAYFSTHFSTRIPLNFEAFVKLLKSVEKSSVEKERLAFLSRNTVTEARPLINQFKVMFVTSRFFYNYRSDITLKPWPLAGSQSTPSSLASLCPTLGIIWQQILVVLKARVLRLWSRELPWSASAKAASMVTWFPFCAHPRHRSSQGFPCQWMEGSISSNLIGYKRRLRFAVVVWEH